MIGFTRELAKRNMVKMWYNSNGTHSEHRYWVEWSTKIGTQKRRDAVIIINRVLEIFVLFCCSFCLSVMRAISGRNFAAKSCSDCQIRHADLVLRYIWFVSSTGQTCPEGRSTNRTQVLCEVLHPTLSRKTREIDHNTGNYVPYSFRWVCGFFNVPC